MLEHGISEAKLYSTLGGIIIVFEILNTEATQMCHAIDVPNFLTELENISRI